MASVPLGFSLRAFFYGLFSTGFCLRAFLYGLFSTGFSLRTFFYGLFSTDFFLRAFFYRLFSTGFFILAFRHGLYLGCLFHIEMMIFKIMVSSCSLLSLIRDASKVDMDCFGFLDIDQFISIGFRNKF
jgi:hypothetical protein